MPRRIRNTGVDPDDFDDEVDNDEPSWDDSDSEDQDTDPEDDSEIEVDADGRSEETFDTEPQTRRQKRQARGQLRDRNIELEDRLSEQSSEIANLRGQMEQLGRLSQQASPPPQTQVDHIAQGLNNIDEEYVSLQKQFANPGLTEEGQADLSRKARLLEGHKMRLIAQGVARDQPRHDPNESARIAFRQQLEADHQDIYTSARNVAVANGEFQYLVSQGAPENRATHDEAMHRTRQRLGIETHQDPPPDRQRGGKSRLSGAGRGASGGSSDKATRIPWDKNLQMMADHTYSDEPNARKRYQMFANNEGRRMKENS